jgi:hypothetical protein
MSSSNEKNQDQEQLKLLSIFHYVVGVLAAIFSCFFIIHLVIGIIAIVSPQSMAGTHSEPPPAFFGWLFAAIGGGMLLLGWTFAVCLIVAGRFLSQRKKHLFCLVMAGVSCLFVPLGTALGVFSIIVLTRPSVKELFTS